MMFVQPIFLSLVLMLGVASSAWAHKGSDAYLDVQERTSEQGIDPNTDGAVREYQFRLALALKDLDLLVVVDRNADGNITWGEVKSSLPQLTALVNQAANLPASTPRCGLQWRFDGLERRTDGAYLRLQASALCPLAQALALHYTLLKEQDASHRLLITGWVGGQALLTTASPQQSVDVVLRAALPQRGAEVPTTVQQPSSGRWATLEDYFRVGFFHLLQGYDHLAFLLALVLPLRLRWGRAEPGAVGAVPASEQWFHLLRTVTAFTIGHSITLLLATAGWLRASPTWVEPVIALSIGLTAGFNLRPVAWLRTDVVALVFGLVHGFGFAGLLVEAAAPDGLLAWALAGFNAGIEMGQLLAVMAWVGVAQLCMHRVWYPRVVVRGGSVVLALLAVWWFWERVSA